MPHWRVKEISPPLRVQMTPNLSKISSSLWTRKSHIIPQRRYHLRARQQGINFKAKVAQYLLTQHLFIKSMTLHIYNINGKKETINTLLLGANSAKWDRALSNKWGGGVQCNGIIGTNTYHLYIMIKYQLIVKWRIDILSVTTYH